MSLTASILYRAAAAGARLRAARLMHPRGRSFSALSMTARAGEPGYVTGARLLDGSRRHRVTVRLSKSIPTPSGWPDVYGLAIRFGRRRPVDLLFSTSNRRPLLRHLFVPTRGPDGFYSSLAAYRTPRFRRIFLGAQVERGGRAVTIAAATRFGRWHPVARVLLGRPLRARTDAKLAFNPVRNTAPDLHTVGFIHRLRDPVYRGSQAGSGRRG